jgi:hypothetical protein
MIDGYRAVGGKNDWQWKLKHPEKTCFSAALPLQIPHNFT